MLHAETILDWTQVVFSDDDIEQAGSKIGNTQRVLEPGMGGARVYHECRGELMHVSQSLDHGGVDQSSFPGR